MDLLAKVIDRAVIDGHSIFGLFVVVAMLVVKREVVMQVKEEEELREVVMAMPWSLSESEVSEVWEKAEELMEMTPVSTMYGIAGLISQCSPGLLTNAVMGSPNVWYSRMVDFYEYVLVIVIRVPLTCSGTNSIQMVCVTM